MATALGFADAPTTVDAFDRTCGLGVIREDGTCSQNAYLALVDPNAGPAVSLDQTPIEVEYVIPDAPPAVDPRRIEMPSGLAWAASAESDADWLGAASTAVGADGLVQPVVRTGALAWGEYRGRIRVASEVPVIRRDFWVELAVDGPPPGGISAIVSAASFQPGPVAPGQIISIFGSGLGPAVGLGPTVRSGSVELGPGRVFVEMNRIGSPVLFTGHNQINAVVPYEVEGSDALTVRVLTPQGASPEFSVPVASTAPSLFTANGSGSGPAAVLNQDVSLNSDTNPAQPGEVLVLFGTGEGRTTPVGTTGRLVTDVLQVAADVEVLIGGQQGEVLFAGPAPGFVGLLQVNVRIPLGVAPGFQPVDLRIGGRASPSGVTVSLR